MSWTYWNTRRIPAIRRSLSAGGGEKVLTEYTQNTPGRLLAFPCLSGEKSGLLPAARSYDYKSSRNAAILVFSCSTSAWE